MLTIDAKTNRLFWGGYPVLLPARCYALTTKVRYKKFLVTTITVTDETLLRLLYRVSEQFTDTHKEIHRVYSFLRGNTILQKEVVTPKSNECFVLKFGYAVGGCQIRLDMMNVSPYVQTLLLLRELDLVCDIQNEIFLFWFRLRLR